MRVFARRAMRIAISEKDEHRRNSLLTKKQESQDGPGDGKPGFLLSSSPDPSTIKVNPSPSMIPRTTGFVVIFSIQVTIPVDPRRSQNNPVNIP